MNARANLVLSIVAAVAMITAACTSDQGAGESTSSCMRAAQEIVDRFDAFVEPYAELTPEEFLADPNLAGLDDFQSDVATTVVGVATNPNDDCTERDLENEVDLALQDYAGEGLLNQYLVGSVLQGLSVETRDVVVSPDDDLLAVLPLLGSGSSVTFTEGTFELNGTLLVQTELTIIGAGRGETILNSTSEAAAIAVLGEGQLVMNNITVRHTGDLPASVLIAFDAPVELVGVGISGALADADGAGGSGIVLTGAAGAEASADAVNGGTLAASETVVTIDDSVVSNNAAAGIAVTSALAPNILNSIISSNAQCGICYFDAGGGKVQSTTFEANQVGIQASDSSTAEIAANNFADNEAAGILIDGSANPLISSNTFDGEDIVGIDVQDDAAPTISLNDFGPHAVAISVRGQSAATVNNNTLDGGDVGILIGGTAAPSVNANEIAQTATAAILHANESEGELRANVVIPGDGAGVVIEGTAAPSYVELTIVGGIVGMAFSQESTGQVSQSLISGQEVGIEVSGEADPTLTDNVFREIRKAGVLFTGSGAPTLSGNLFDGVAEIAVQAGGTASPLIDGNSVEGAETSILVVQESMATISNNTLTDQNFAIGVSGDATPTIKDNAITGARAGAISFDENSSGEARNNMVTDAGVVGIRVGGDATPLLDANSVFARVVLPPAEESAPDTGDTDSDEAQSGAGLLFVERGAGEATGNQVFGFVIGVQISDSAEPILSENRIDGAGVGGVGFLYGLEGAGEATNNVALNQQLGFQISGQATPTLTENSVEEIAVAGFLIQGTAAPELSGNDCGSVQPGIVLLDSAAPELSDNQCQVAQ